MVDQNVKNKIKEYLKGSPDKFEKVIKFLEEEANADYNTILVASVKVDQTFQYLVDKLVKEIDYPRVSKESSSIPAGKSKAVPDGSRKLVPVSDGVRTFSDTSSSLIDMETVLRVTGKLAGALVGTAVSPGIGTVIGGVVGGQLAGCRIRQR